MTTSRTMKSIARITSPMLWAIPMGTGAISMLFFAFPYGQGSQPMAILSLIFHFLNVVLFILFNAFTAARIVLYPKSLIPVLRHPRHSLFFACYPMGATTILSVSISVIYQYYGFGGKLFVYFVWSLWWINIAISTLCFWGGTHLMITRQTHSLEVMTATWLLPVVAFVVASSTGAVIAEPLSAFSAHSALVTLAVSAFILTAGLLLASMMLTVYILRLIVYGFPPGTSVLSVFLPLGVAAQSGYSISTMGAVLGAILPLPSSSRFFTFHFSADTINVFTSIVAFILWSWSVMWIIYALLGLVHVLRRTKIKFKLSAWGLVFPNGVFSNLTVHLADVFDSSFFRVVGAIYCILTFLLWCFMAYKTLVLIPSLFKDPPSDVEEDKQSSPSLHETPQVPAHLPDSDSPYTPKTASVDSNNACQTPGYESTLVEYDRMNSS